MAEIVWGENREYESGLDRGVLYPQNGDPVAWDGLVSVSDEADQEKSTYYVDGKKYLVAVTPREFRAKIEAYTFPTILSEMCGIVEIADGLFLDEQPPKPFSLCYRTMIGNGPHYRLHILYWLMGTFSGLTHETLSDTITPSNFVVEVEGKPLPIEGYRPTSHIILDTSNIPENTVSEIEAMLYGTDSSNPQLPPIQTLFDMLNFGDVLVIRDNGDGSFSIDGSYRNITIAPDGSFRVVNLKDEQVIFNPDGEVGFYDLVITP